MITFFVLLILYCGLFPFLGFHIVQRRIKRIGRLRVIINTRHAAHQIHREMKSWFMLDEQLIFDFLESNIDKVGLQWTYQKYYGENLIDEFRKEFNGENFNKAYKLINREA